MNNETQTNTSPRTFQTGPAIYVASLSAYNAGELHGAWIDATQDAEGIQADIDAMLARDPHKGEEWAIHDFMHFDCWNVSEHASLESVSVVASLLEKHGPAFTAWLKHVVGTPGIWDREDLEDSFLAEYAGEYDDGADYVYRMAEECGDLDRVLEFYRNYIDWEAIARDHTLNGDFHEIEARNGRVYIFHNN